MNREEYIALELICSSHELDVHFFEDLGDLGLIEITHFDAAPFIHREFVSEAEKMIRLHRELELNAQGVETVFRLLNKIEELQQQLMEARSRLNLYE